MNAFLISGPPCAGKTTFARAIATLVIDWDEIYSQVTGLPLHERSGDREHAGEAERIFRLKATAAAAAAEPGRIAAIIRTCPERALRAMLRAMYRARSIVLAVPADICIERVRGRTRAARARALSGISEWWLRFEPSWSGSDLVCLDWADLVNSAEDDARAAAPRACAEQANASGQLARAGGVAISTADVPGPALTASLNARGIGQPTGTPDQDQGV